jgi:CO/xanthine dehydrogenase FAD-binding subunit
VDITRIPGLGDIRESGGHVLIGPLVTHDAITRSPVIAATAPLLAAACRSVGGPQIRHAGTLVGSVVNAQPAADGAVALFALDAELEITRLTGAQWMPIASLYAGVGVCLADPTEEMITGIRFRRLAAGDGWGIQRLARRKALCLPILNTAAVVTLSGERIERARIAVGPVAQMPLRPTAAEAFLQGQIASADVLSTAAELAAQAAQPRDSALRGSREYRIAMVRVLVRRALYQACGMRGD